MATIQIQLLPETFELPQDRFEVKKLPITKEFADDLISTIYLCEDTSSKVGRVLGQQTLIFRGVFGRQFGTYLQNNTNLESRYIFEFLSESEESLTILAPESPYFFDPSTRTTKIDIAERQIRYFFKIDFVS